MMTAAGKDCGMCSSLVLLLFAFAASKPQWTDRHCADTATVAIVMPKSSAEQNLAWTFDAYPMHAYAVL